MNDVKQVIVINKGTTPRMNRGKEIAQGAHAAMAFMTGRLKHLHGGLFSADFTPAERDWMTGNFRKVTVQVSSEAELRELHNRALNAGIESHLITDSGLTEFGGVPTVTALAIGPDYDEKIDQITGSLALY